MRRRVQWGETDAAGIIYYPNYFRWFDQATHDFLRERGASVRQFLAQGHALPIVEANARFMAALRYEDEVWIHTRVAEVRTRAVRFEHRVTRDETPIGEGYEVRMWVQLPDDGGGLIPETIPDELRALLLTGEE